MLTSASVIILIALYIAILLVTLAVYMAPAIVAWINKHPQRLYILVFNIIMGVTVVGWCVALAWAILFKLNSDLTNFIEPLTPKNKAEAKKEG